MDLEMADVAESVAGHLGPLDACALACASTGLRSALGASATKAMAEELAEIEKTIEGVRRAVATLTRVRSYDDLVKQRRFWVATNEATDADQWKHAPNRTQPHRAFLGNAVDCRDCAETYPESFIAWLMDDDKVILWIWPWEVQIADPGAKYYVTYTPPEGLVGTVAGGGAFTKTGADDSSDDEEPQPPPPPTPEALAAEDAALALGQGAEWLRAYRARLNRTRKQKNVEAKAARKARDRANRKPRLPPRRFTRFLEHHLDRLLLCDWNPPVPDAGIGVEAAMSDTDSDA